MNVQWRKSTHSSGVNDEDCVELGRLSPGAGIGVRDSKDPEAGHLALSVAQFAALIEQVKQHPAR
ncbi:DUF397 domain-containing protein [Actinomadura sp. NAK00032]|uniref:DUF397 domain-containing protein n=1 Tax=Actinomadura sp. NAK00032 TaxID=2742128 RepID=UPI001591BC06|nr:DUF397 domain-containing protein [Actinomadura sp. NAK00032]QKW33466.1 DUF397 domain-containing protein [Actinomadura sp. NAK00032]